jgi:hypothetical protein
MPNDQNTITATLPEAMYEAVIEHVKSEKYGGHLGNFVKLAIREKFESDNPGVVFTEDGTLLLRSAAIHGGISAVSIPNSRAGRIK